MPILEYVHTYIQAGVVLCNLTWNGKMGNAKCTWAYGLHWVSSHQHNTTHATQVCCVVCVGNVAARVTRSANKWQKKGIQVWKILENWLVLCKLFLSIVCISGRAWIECCRWFGQFIVNRKKIYWFDEQIIYFKNITKHSSIYQQYLIYVF